MGEYEKLWLLGVALDEPANVWGIQSPPEDWTQVGVERVAAAFPDLINRS